MFISSKKQQTTRSYTLELLLILNLLCAICLPLVRLANCETNTTNTSEINHATTSELIKPKLPTLHVTNLRIIPELRAAKLSWNYERKATIFPTAFSIRFCELTSWDDEIKCRNKEFKVQDAIHNAPPTATGPQTLRRGDANSLDSTVDDYATLKTNNNPNLMLNLNNDLVIKTSQRTSKNNNNFLQSDDDNHNMAYVKSAVASKEKQSILVVQYEAHIYDLRAQTNYTFRVQASRFNDPDLNKLMSAKKSSLASPSNLQLHLRPSGQRLHLTDSSASHNENEIIDSRQYHSMLNGAVVETKSFGAEATRCLADVSEVVINTGRFFGGRISVEESQDPRCQMLGNRSSDQTTYLFRIDHELCRSKLVDGQRIETIVLVHENKDILTHNTARFLVLCNFLQNSFTLKASVSLPKVNGLMSSSSTSKTSSSALSSQPRTVVANITQLPGKPMAIVAQHQPQILENFAASQLNRRQQQQNSMATTHDGLPVRLGLMPGFFRSKHHATPRQQHQPRLLDMQASIAETGATWTMNNNHLVARNGNDSNDHHDHSNDKPSTAKNVIQQPLNEITEAIKRASGQQHDSILQRRNIVVGRARSPPMQVASATNDATNDLVSEASDALSSAANHSLLAPQATVMPVTQPEPVQVQSPVLRIAAPDPSASTREARQLLPNGVSLIRSAASLQTLQAVNRIQQHSRDTDSSSQSSLGQAQTLLTRPANTTARSNEREIVRVMTNNHRVIDNFPSLSTPPQATTPLRQAPRAEMAPTTATASGQFDQNYTIKYSGAPDVDNYSLGTIGDTLAAGVASSSSSSPPSPPSPSESDPHSLHGTPIEVRSGDPMSPRMGKALEGEQETQNDPGQQQFTLAQNITNQLLKFSLRTLTNVARRTVEMLAKGAENGSKQSEESNGVSNKRLPSPRLHGKTASKGDGSSSDGDQEGRDRANYERAQMSANEMIMMSMNNAGAADEDEDYEDSSQPPDQGETPTVRDQINRHTHNQGREHVKLIDNKDTAAEAITIAGTSTLPSSSSPPPREQLNAADANNNDTIKTSRDNYRGEISNNNDNLGPPAKISDQITEIKTTTSKRPLPVSAEPTSQFAARFSGNHSGPNEESLTSSKNKDNREQQQQESINHDSKRAPSGRRANGSRSLKHQPAIDNGDDELNATESDGFILRDTRRRSLKSHNNINDNDNDNNKSSASAPLDTTRRFNQVFEFREPVKRRSLTYWPLFCLIVLACIASAFVILIWFVSMYFASATFNQNNNHNPNDHHNNDVMTNKDHVDSPGTQQLGAKLVGSPSKQQKNGSRPPSANNNKSQLMSKLSREQKQLKYPHGNNNNEQHENESSIKPSNSDQAQQQTSAKPLEPGDEMDRMYATTTTTSHKLSSIGNLNGTNFGCGRALSPSIRTLPPSLFRNCDDDDGDENQHRRSSIGFENNRSGNNFVTVATNFRDELLFSPVKQNQQHNLVGAYEPTTTTTRYSRPRSHCSSRGSDRTMTNTSRSSFSHSISNGSTTLIAKASQENQENLWRDNELLFSEHVLINLGAHRGESYA